MLDELLEGGLLFEAEAIKEESCCIFEHLNTWDKQGCRGEIACEEGACHVICIRMILTKTNQDRIKQSGAEDGDGFGVVFAQGVQSFAPEGLRLLGDVGIDGGYTVALACDLTTGKSISTSAR